MATEKKKVSFAPQPQLENVILINRGCYEFTSPDKCWKQSKCEWGNDGCTDKPINYELDITDSETPSSPKQTNGIVRPFIIGTLVVSCVALLLYFMGAFGSNLSTSEEEDSP